PAADSNLPARVPSTSQLATFTDMGFTSSAAETVETFSATIDWGDLTAPTASSVTVTQGSPGVLTTGAVSGTHTFASGGDYRAVITVTDDDEGSMQVSLLLHVRADSPAQLSLAL